MLFICSAIYRHIYEVHLAGTTNSAAPRHVKLHSWRTALLFGETHTRTPSSSKDQLTRKPARVDGCPFSLLSGPECSNDIFFRNVEPSPNYTVLQPSQLYSLILLCLPCSVLMLPTLYVKHLHLLRMASSGMLRYSSQSPLWKPQILHTFLMLFGLVCYWLHFKLLRIALEH
jgi:hypothetical protein